MTYKLDIFWIVWLVLLFLTVGSCLSESWCEDTVLLDGVYAMSLLSTWLCHNVKPRVAFGNLIVMIFYNAILTYNLVFNSRYGNGMIWWFYALLLNTVHSIALLVFVIANTSKRKKLENDR